MQSKDNSNSNSNNNTVFHTSNNNDVVTNNNNTNNAITTTNNVLFISHFPSPVTEGYGEGREREAYQQNHPVMHRLRPHWSIF